MVVAVPSGSRGAQDGVVDSMRKTVDGRRKLGVTKSSGLVKGVSRVQLCAFCLGSEEKNRSTGRREPLATCAKCGSNGTCGYDGAI